MWPVPSKIEPPSAGDYLFIRLKYELRKVGRPGDTLQSLPTNKDEEFSQHHFHDPASVMYEQAIGLSRLSDSTFEALCQATSPKYFSNAILTKNDLFALAAQEFEFYNEDEEDNGHASLDQIASYLLFKCKRSEEVQWGRIAELYNDSTQDQQQALAYYFDRCENRDLLDLLSTRAPAFEMPTALQETFVSKKEHGETLTLDDETGEWARNDLFENRYEVYLRDSEHFSMLLGTGPTEKTALAKAIAYVRDSGEPAMSKVMLIRSNQVLADGNIEYRNVDDLSQPVGKPMVTWLPRHPQDLESLKKTIYTVEKALGIQWAKVRRLEDELGM